MNRACDRIRCRAHRGAFTLVELIATVSVLAALGSVASLILFSAFDSYLAAATRAQVHTEMSVALDRIVREIRMTGIDADAPVVAADLNAISTSSITWNGSSSVQLVNGQLLLNASGAGAEVLLDDVSSFVISAFDESNNQIATPLDDAGCDAVRRLRFELSITRNGVTESLPTRIHLRATIDGAGA